MTEQLSNNLSSFNASFNTQTDYKPLELYCIQDRKTGKFMPPFFCANEDDAIRQCKQIVNYAPSLINKFPQDYALYFCGCFDEYHGCISASNSILDGFIAYLDEYVTDDTVKYDELKKDIEEKKFVLDNNIAQLEKLSDKVEQQCAKMTILYNKYESSFNSRSKNIEDYNKESIISKLFNKH